MCQRPSLLLVGWGLAASGPARRRVVGRSEHCRLKLRLGIDPIDATVVEGLDGPRGDESDGVKYKIDGGGRAVLDVQCPSTSAATAAAGEIDIWIPAKNRGEARRREENARVEHRKMVRGKMRRR